MRSLISTLLLLLLFTSISVTAQVVVRGEGKLGNPTLLFKGISGDRALSAKVQSDLQKCGWFSVVSGGKSDFIVSGKQSGSSLTLDVANGAGVTMYSVTSSNPETDKLAHTAVDAILKKEFGIDGICRTKILFSAETGNRQREIYICDFDGGNIKRLTENATLSIEPSWHPDGRSIIYNQFLLSSTPLVQYDIVNNRSRALSSQRGINAGKISPDGRKLALIITTKNQIDLYVRSLDGGTPVRLTNDTAVEASPTWSPDSSSICYVSDKSGRPALYIISASGGQPRKVPGVLGSESVSPAWSKDNKLAYSARLGGYTLKVIDLSTAMGYPAPKNNSNSILADSSAPAAAGESPSWAPDNRHVVLSSKGSIYVVDTRTNKARVLISGKSKSSGASWSPLLY